MIDIFFATKRLSISSEQTEGYEVTPDAEWGITRASLLNLFEHHSWVTIRTSSEQQSQRVYLAFAEQFCAVTAAGGVVARDDKAILMIHRNGRWDLPKGHWEEGETIEECAIREVEEECGVTGLSISEFICTTLHCYYLRDKWELKSTHWYAMRSSDTTPPTPQVEEGIDRVEWVEPQQLGENLKGSFPTIKGVVGVLRLD